MLFTLACIKLVFVEMLLSSLRMHSCLAFSLDCLIFISAMSSRIVNRILTVLTVCRSFVFALDSGSPFLLFISLSPRFIYTEEKTSYTSFDLVPLLKM